MASCCCTQVVMPPKTETLAPPEVHGHGSALEAPCCCSPLDAVSPREDLRQQLPEEWDVFVVKTTGRREIGLEVTSVKQQRLQVLNVKDGLIKDWNVAQSCEDLRIAPGHSIVAVNGASGSSARLLQTIRHDNELRLTILRFV
mmetsp:Transcript_5145/g.12096  ORF Transcript_5145/g.12096 Transcript_5145/m.12096 type:complete len:143 (+) Transcript_5145:83-511(+)